MFFIYTRDLKCSPIVNNGYIHFELNFEEIKISFGLFKQILGLFSVFDTYLNIFD